MRGAWLGAATAMLLLGSCSCEAEPEGRPEDAVRRLFDGIERRDCEAVAAQLGGDVLAEFEEIGCAEALEVLDDRAVERVGQGQPDGREPDAILVPIWYEGARERAVVRVEARDGAWKVVSL